VFAVNITKTPIVHARDQIFVLILCTGVGR